MRGEILLRGDDLVEGVHESGVGHLAALSLGQHAALRVAAVAGVERAVVVGLHVRVAEFERGEIPVVDLGHGQFAPARDEGVFGGEPAAAEVLVEELVDRVERAADVGSGADQGFADGLHPYAFLPERGDVDARPRFVQRVEMSVFADDDLLFRPRRVVEEDREIRSGHFAEEVLQLLRRVKDGRRGAFADDDAVVCFPVFRESQHDDVPPCLNCT